MSMEPGTKQIAPESEAIVELAEGVQLVGGAELRRSRRGSP